MRLLHVHRHLLSVGPPTTTGNRTAGDAEYAQANFDTNMVIILAALLCALIVALGLNTIVRCVLRCSRRLGMETAEQAAARVSATGLKKSALRKIPIIVYGSEINNQRLSSGVEGDYSECPICLGEFVDGEKVRVLPKCNHGFHVSCIDTWLGSHSSCPNCRHSLVDTSAKSISGGERQDHVVVEVDGES